MANGIVFVVKHKRIKIKKLFMAATDAATLKMFTLMGNEP